MTLPTTFDYSTLPTDVAGPLREQAARIRERVKNTTIAIIEIGRDLLAVKQQKLQHGQFCTWVEAECQFTIRTAANYMRAAEFAGGKLETVSNLSPAIIYRLAGKSSPPEIVTEVISRIESGASISEEEIKAKLSAAASQKRDAKLRELKASRHSKAARQERERRQQEYEQQQQRERKHLEQVVSDWIKQVGENVVAATCAAVDLLECHQSYEFFDEIKRQRAGVEDAA
jgi:hypothetical protein